MHAESYVKVCLLLHFIRMVIFLGNHIRALGFLIQPWEKLQPLTPVLITDTDSNNHQCVRCTCSMSGVLIDCVLLCVQMWMSVKREHTAALRVRSATTYLVATDVTARLVTSTMPFVGYALVRLAHSSMQGPYRHDCQGWSGKFLVT